MTGTVYTPHILVSTFNIQRKGRRYLETYAGQTSSERDRRPEFSTGYHTRGKRTPPQIKQDTTYTPPISVLYRHNQATGMKNSLAVTFSLRTSPTSMSYTARIGHKAQDVTRTCSNTAIVFDAESYFYRYQYQIIKQRAVVPQPLPKRQPDFPFPILFPFRSCLSRRPLTKPNPLT